MAALSRATVPGRFERTIGSETGAPALRRSDFSTSLTPFSMRARVELPSRAARDFSWRYTRSGISTVVRMCSLCHIYGVDGASGNDPLSRPTNSHQPLIVDGEHCVAIVNIGHRLRRHSVCRAHSRRERTDRLHSRLLRSPPNAGRNDDSHLTSGSTYATIRPGIQQAPTMVMQGFAIGPRHKRRLDGCSRVRSSGEPRSRTESREIPVAGEI